MTEENNNKEQPISNGYIIGLNIGLLAIYTVISRVIEGGIIIDALLIAIHVLICLFTAAIVQRWVWALAALAILLIGFSTCVSLMGNTL